jgi:hypothetical protein
MNNVSGVSLPENLPFVEGRYVAAILVILNLFYLTPGDKADTQISGKTGILSNVT